jgi:protein TonB
MFTNLIESNSHKREFRRRSSFFVATVAGYALLLTTAGIVGILTYDARVEAQNMDLLLESWIPPVTPERPKPDQPRRVPSAKRVSDRPTRPILYESASSPTKPPEIVSAAPNPIPPAPADAVVAPYISDPPTSSTSSSCETCTGNSTPPAPVVENRTPPPVVEPPKPAMLRVSPGVILAKIIDLPKPAYPIIARQARIQGPVNVQILIDETGRVVSAQAVKGSPMLTKAAEDAARRARFTPTKLGDDAVKVQGVITYNFVLQ